MTPLELQALVGRMLPTDINCTVEWFGESGQIKVSNWCNTVDACEIFATQLDQPEDMVRRTLRPFLQQALKDLRSLQTKNRAGAH